MAKSFFNTGLLGAAGSSGPVDDQFNRVSFLSHFEGSNNGVNNAFDDSSSSNHTITANGNVTQGSFGPFGTNWSHEFLPDTGNAAIVGGTGDRDSVNNDATRISVPASASNFAWGNPFTIEFFCFLRKLSTSNAGGFSYDLDNNFILNQVNGNALESNGGPPDSAFSIVERAGNLVINVYYDPAGDGSQASVTNAASHASNTTSTGDDFAVNTWHHVAMTWDGSNYYGYVDGVRKATINSSTAPHRSDEPIRIGGLRSGNANEYGNMDGFISNVRIVIGTNLYPNNNFTPPTSQLTAVTNTKLLTCHSNRMLDGSSIGGTVTADPQDTGMNAAALQGKVSNFGPFLNSAVYDPAVNGASAYFDGSGDYLSFPDSADWDFGTGDFTVEGWVNPASDLASDTQFIGFGDGDNGGNFGFEATGKPYFYHGGYYARTSTALNLGSWSHIAFVRSSGTLSCYINGTSAASSSYTGNVGGSLAPRVGAYSGGQYFKGYMQDVRILKGTAVYTSNFTPPTAPLTAITNTKLLLNMADGQAIDSAAQNNLTLFGNAKISTGQAKFGNTSMVFDGTGDYVTLPSSSFTPFGTGDFTIECFARFDAIDGKGLFQLGASYLPSAITGPAVFASIGTNNPWRIYYGTSHADASVSPSANTWYHVAYVRSSGVTKLYVDGTSVISQNDTTNYTNKFFVIGGAYSSSFLMDGYIDDFRISHMARYTSNFTAPSEPFADKGQ